jgi:Kdo2-lipid IVA lauroyltransferase/acyltransferase
MFSLGLIQLRILIFGFWISLALHLNFFPVPKKRSNLQNKSELFIVRSVLGTIGMLPVSASMKGGEAFAKISARLLKRLRFVGLRNLELAFPELSPDEREEILKGSFESLGRQMGLVSHFSRLTPEKLREMVDVEGLEHLQKAQDEKRGVILFSGHFGGWELSISSFPAFGFDWNVLVRRIDNPLIEDLVESLRSLHGTTTIDKKTSARGMYRLLQKGERLGILADLNSQEREGVFVDFFGIPASTATGLARLALRTKSIVLPFFTIWQEEKERYLLKVCPPVEVPEGGDTEKNTRILTQTVTSVIEEYVRLYPKQWMWIHKRWNTRPPGEPNLYEKGILPKNSVSKAKSGLD